MKLEGLKDFQLDQEILGLVEPGRVERVTLKATEEEIAVRVIFADTPWACPAGQKRRPIHD